MATINQVCLVGRLTKDPFNNSTENITIAGFILACENGDKDKTTSFIPCKVFGASASNVLKYCKKGSLVGVSGKLKQSVFTDKNGNEKNIIEVIASTVTFISTPKEKPSESEEENPW